MRWVAEVAGKDDKSQSRVSSFPKVGRRASLQVTIATLTVGVVSMEGRQSVALELHSIRLELHTELAAQSQRKILHVGFKLCIKTNHNWTTKAGSPAAF